MTDSTRSGTRGWLLAWMAVLCVVLGVTVAGVVMTMSYYREQRAVRYVEAVGGQTTGILPGGPDWVYRLMGRDAVDVFDRVSIVNLSGTGISDAGLLQLYRLTKLDTLHLDDTGITDAGLAHLHGITKLYVHGSPRHDPAISTPQLTFTMPQQSCL